MFKGKNNTRGRKTVQGRRRHASLMSDLALSRGLSYGRRAHVVSPGDTQAHFKAQGSLRSLPGQGVAHSRSEGPGSTALSINHPPPRWPKAPKLVLAGDIGGYMHAA